MQNVNVMWTAERVSTNVRISHWAGVLLARFLMVILIASVAYVNVNNIINNLTVPSNEMHDEPSHI